MFGSLSARKVQTVLRQLKASYLHHGSYGSVSYSLLAETVEKPNSHCCLYLPGEKGLLRDPFDGNKYIN